MNIQHHQLQKRPDCPTPRCDPNKQGNCFSGLQGGRMKNQRPCESSVHQEENSSLQHGPGSTLSLSSQAGVFNDLYG